MEEIRADYNQTMAEGHNHLKNRNLEEAQAAFNLAFDHTSNLQEILSSEQMYLICSSMLGNHEEAIDQFRDLFLDAKAQANDIFTGDVARDLVMAVLRKPELETEDFDEAASFIELAKELHGSDKNRYACLIGATGRLELRRKNFAAATENFLQADILWQENPDTNEQWVFNNLSHWLVAEAAAACETQDAQQMQRHLKNVQTIGNRIIDGTPKFGTPNHAQRARAIIENPQNWRSINDHKT